MDGKEKLNNLQNLQVDLDLNGEKMLKDLSAYLSQAMEMWLDQNAFKYVNFNGPHIKKEDQ